ncbi:MAG: recombinase family protein [Pirellulaceae bacterium]
MNTSELIQPRHLDRKAMIYVRQSSPNQVITNKESQRMQYALRERAAAFGWHEQDTNVIDADLGRSGTTIDQREGFQHLVAQIALDTVGILFAFDATRLARNCSHWYQLLDLCGHHDCLIADRDGVYDPTSINGRLLLGLKGQISELELHTIRARLTAGILSKAERGELGLTLPTGLIRTDGVVTKHPSAEVRDRIDSIFATFFGQKSVAQTVRWFIRNDLLLPRRNRHGDIRWKRVTAASISSFLNNPAYAGAAVYGRTRWKKSDNTGKMHGIMLPPQQWRYCVQGKYPEYISWDTFERIQAMLHDNYSEYARNKTRGIPREGKALLHGIMYCGECGHKMCVQYKDGTQYLCNHLKQQTGAPVCQRIGGDAIDDAVVSWFFEALSVAEIDVAAAALQSTDSEHAHVVAAHQQQVERLQYESQRAERQFMQSDPENRLVTGELERRWEANLRELKSAEEELDHLRQDAPSYIIPEDLLDVLRDVGPRLPELWHAKLLSDAQKKALLRSLIDKVVIHRLAPDRVQTRVVWRGGATTSDVVRVTVGKFAWLTGGAEMEAAKQMTAEGLSDVVIAEHLTATGHRSPRADKVLESTVRLTRLRLGILRNTHQSHPRRVAGFLTIPQLARKLGVSRWWISDRIHKGTIKAKKDEYKKCYLFADTPKMLAELKALVAEYPSKVGCGKGHQDE